LDYGLGVRKESFSVHLDFGTAIHYAIEKFKPPGDAEPCKNPVKVFEDKFNELFKENSKFYEEGQKSKKVQLLEAGARILWKLEDLPQVKEGTVLANEFELYEPIPGTDLSFKGFVDISLICKDVLGNSWVYTGDLKSCSSPWSLEDLQNDGLLLQVLLYKYFLAKKMEIDLSEVRTAYIFLCKSAKQDPPVVWFEVNSSVPEIKKALKYLVDTIKEMRVATSSETFTKNRSNCRNRYGLCSYFDTEYCSSEDLTKDQIVQIRKKPKSGY
jgi:hypothetical protein